MAWAEGDSGDLHIVHMQHRFLRRGGDADLDAVDHALSGGQGSPALIDHLDVVLPDFDAPELISREQHMHADMDPLIEREGDLGAGVLKILTLVQAVTNNRP